MNIMKKGISIIMVLAMSLSLLAIPAFAEEAKEPEKVITDNTLLTEPFDVTYEDEVDAGIYPYDEKTVLVKLGKKTASLNAEGISGIDYLFKAKDGFWYTANLADGITPKDAIETLRSKDDVLLAEYNFMYETNDTTLCDGDGVYEGVNKNPRCFDQWYLDSCGLQKSWKDIKDSGKNPGGDSGIVVAVIDTGVDYDHEDLKNNMWVNTGEIPGDGIDNDGNGYIDDYYGVNIVARKGNGDDDQGHGTHVAGIIAAANNNRGIVGIAHNAKIMAIKAGQASGYFLQTDICKAINYARENGADVINMSFGGSASTIAVQDALEEAYTHSVLVAAAGNDSAPNEKRYPYDPEVKPCYPAAYSFVLGVMSVDSFGVESGFTNYDIKSYNDVEYELYAPGNAIISTIPNDRYATWSGTSMAAPIVSGMAAVLRSVYDDPDKYPTKFIYGQLASTSERRAICPNPKEHKHKSELPRIVNLYNALTKLPKPEVSVSDYTTFDTSDINSKNNGDGTIDAGETISLGFELRNRWGMSKDTVVTIDALSQADIPNPYVEFSTDGKSFSKSASMNYGSVGTYSTQDCGKEIQNDLWTGWKNPFYLKVSKDTPNETILAINVNIDCKNALNESDKKTYSSEPVTINLVVKNGVVLPQIIDKDMTLTKDNYYIIPNSTVIEEGATVTVTEGTNIQFWTNDKTDAYADSYIAGLVVKGKLNCIGTEDEPVKIFPSDLMGRYSVEIYQSGKGEINYKHTDITNLYTGNNTGFAKAENCEFNQNYKDTLYGRYLESGQVKTNYRYGGVIRGNEAENCAFYKLGGHQPDYYYSLELYVNCKNCIFVDSFIDFNNNYTYENCVFYGNNNYWDSKSEGGTSSMSPMKFGNYANVSKIVRDEKTGRTYIQVNLENRIYETLPRNNLNKLAKYMGGTLTYIETEEEQEFLKKSGLTGLIGAKLNNDGEFEWLNGEKLGDFITINNPTSRRPCLCLSCGTISREGYSSAIIELPGEIRIEEISLPDKSVSLETSGTYKIAPQIYPSAASSDKVRYFSSNEAVATVDENGVVTPIDTGTATLYVFSEDMQVKASMQIDVKQEVKATGISAPEKMQINIGETKALNASAKPSNTTKQIKYKSADEGIAKIDSDGNITAVSEGFATITATVSNDDESFEATTIVHCVFPTESLDIEDEYIVTKLSDECSIIPTVSPDNATIKSYKWESSNKSVCYVDENGNLVKNKPGIAILKATSDYSDAISDTITVVVADNEYTNKDIKSVRAYEYESYALLEDWTIWMWDSRSPINIILSKKLNVQFDGQIDDFFIDGYTLYILSDKTLYMSSNSIDADTISDFEICSGYDSKQYSTLTLNNVDKIYAEGNVCYIACDDGHVYTHDYNTSFRQVEDLPINPLKDIYIDCYQPFSDCNTITTYFLIDSDNYPYESCVYVLGYYGGIYYDKATCILKNISSFNGGYADSFILGDASLTSHSTNGETLIRLEQNRYLSYIIGSSEQELYTKTFSSINDYNEWETCTNSGIYNVEKVYDAIGMASASQSYGFGDPSLYYKTTDNQLFAWNVGYHTPNRIILGVEYADTEPYCDENNFSNLKDIVLDENGNVLSSVLSENQLTVDLNTTLFSSSCSLINGDEKVYISDQIDGSKMLINLQYRINEGKIIPGNQYLLNLYCKNTQGISKTITITFTYQPNIEENTETNYAALLSDEKTLPAIELFSGSESFAADIPADSGRHLHSFTTETVMPTAEADGKITNTCECGVVTETILPKLTERKMFTAGDYTEKYNEFIAKGFNTNVFGSAILNRLNDTDVTKWLRITAPEGSEKYGFGGNWWGTTNSELINHQIVDYNDFITLGDINEGEILTEAPENTFPFVTEAYILDESGEEQNVVSGGKVQFVVKFNRDMDKEYGLKVYFGSAYPYADYEINGAFTDDRTWVGETTLKTVIENGYQFIRVTSGRTAADENGEHLKLYNDWARFGFKIDTTSAMAMMMQGYADDDGVHLEWMQDDYDTLAGYNVYRSTSEDGNYIRLNKTIIPSEENTYTDTDVEPGIKYYYTFTTVLTDVSNESKPAGKISITAKDTMAPNVYHSPVYTATTGSKVIISATVSDNIGVQSAKLYYRVKGSDEWKTAEMTSSNDKYTASIPASSVTLSGIEYYIAAFDGVNYTYAGNRTSENPYEITVYPAVESNAKGDVDGDGSITVLDALKLLRAIYDESLLTQEEFLRADINGDGVLSAVEALRILQYANGSISSVLW